MRELTAVGAKEERGFIARGLLNYIGKQVVACDNKVRMITYYLRVPISPSDCSLTVFCISHCLFMEDVLRLFPASVI